jgi:hypothetical protein
LFSDDLAPDFGVSSLGNNLFANQFSLGFVGPAINDLLRILFANAGQSIELIFAGGVDINQIGRRLVRHGGVRSLFGSFSGLRAGYAAQQNQ